ncbi:MAG TPA: pyridoxamine 5'-phosphate oxidase family protein [Gaiellaceae bacterium]|nr:pyridoxamine 5'-phosphate oxidase family protein [Gaiellaceae bacterium]
MRRSRPRFSGYGISTNEEGMLPWSWADERLAAAHNYWVATASAGRGPAAKPVWGLWRDGVFVFNTGERSRTALDLAADPRVVVHLESGDEVVVLEGSVEVVAGSAELSDAYDAKYSFRVPDGSSWYGLRPRRAFAWREKDYPQSATRFDFDE